MMGLSSNAVTDYRRGHRTNTPREQTITTQTNQDDQSNTYLRERTDRVRSGSTAASRHSMANPFHYRFPVSSPPPAINSPRAKPTDQPVQLSTITRDGSKTPARKITWQKSDLSTPLNTMKTGTSAQWSHTATTVEVTLPNHPPKPNRDLLAKMKQGIASRTGVRLSPIAEHNCVTPDKRGIPDIGGGRHRIILICNRRDQLLIWLNWQIESHQNTQESLFMMILSFQNHRSVLLSWWHC